MATTYALQVTEADRDENEFRTLGGAAWVTRSERDTALASIPEGPSEPAVGTLSWIVDVLDGDDIVGDRSIDEETAKTLLGVRSLDELRAEARRRNTEAAREARERIAHRRASGDADPSETEGGSQ